MNKKVYTAEVLVLLLAAKAAAQPCYNLIGYANCSFVAGSNLFNNPFQLSDNSLNGIFSTNSAPEGTIVSLWNPVTSAFDTNSTFTNGSWSTNLELPPGTGALVKAPSSFAFTVAGTVLNHDGGQLCPGFLPPPVFTGPNGIYLLGDKAPLTDTDTNIFLNIVGRVPFVGEQVIQLTNTSTYLGNGMWDTVPTLVYGTSAFLNIMTEPSPLLSIVQTNGQAIVSWPPTTSVWSLQTNGDLVAGSWSNYTGTVANNTVTNPLPAGNLFFRLSYP
jgi:hypothetical protein